MELLGGSVRDVQKRGDARNSATNDLLERNEMGCLDEGVSDLLSWERNSSGSSRVGSRKMGGG